ncbi:MAG: hypothetical protein RI885_2646 [Actinomycetota bacterium]|jgi:hypothetical protein
MPSYDGSIVAINQVDIAGIQDNINRAISELTRMHEDAQKNVATQVNEWTNSPSDGAIAYREREAKIVRFIGEVHDAAHRFAASIGDAGELARGTDGKVSGSMA